MRRWTTMGTPLRLTLAVVALAVILPVAWYLGSPLFITTTIDEEFPVAAQAASESAASTSPAMATPLPTAPPAPPTAAVAPQPTSTVESPMPSPAPPTATLAPATTAPASPSPTAQPAAQAPAPSPPPAAPAQPTETRVPPTATSRPPAVAAVQPTAAPAAPTVAPPPPPTPAPTATMPPQIATPVPPTATPVPPTTPLAPSGPTALLRGQFTVIDALHRAEGTATIYRLADGQRVLRFENFKSANGPGLFVYLAGHPKPRSGGEFHDSGAIELAPLKATSGNQNYALPPDLDLAAFRSAVIYCKPFSVVFSTAELRPV